MRFVDAFGGYANHGLVEGQWVDSTTGRRLQNRSWMISVACGNDRLAEAEQMVIAIGKELGELEVFFEVRDFDGLRFLRTS